MIEAAINGALPRGIEFNGNALAIAQFKTPSSPLSDPRPTIELMRSININELRHAIPRYSNTSTSPMSALNISTLPVCVFPPPASKSLTISGAYSAFVSYGYEPVLADIVLYWSAVAAICQPTKCACSR